jgi:hypothetical protein
MSSESKGRFGGALPLPRFVQHPLTALIVAAAHVYLASGHLVKLFAGGGVHWTDIWKGFGALAGAYVFTALASRALVRRRAFALPTQETDRGSIASPAL